MEAFKALSSEDKWRVRRAVFRGEAPGDTRIAAAAVELAESYQHPRLMRWLCWLAAVISVGAMSLAIISAVDGDLLRAVVLALVALTNIGHLAFNPATRPKNAARSLEASRRIVAQGG
jgi:hypothetical protein